ncbi:RDD family protein [Streptomyces sp. NPDC088348]|uniref:RDD family protein n=1 Tax=Streptomyces sp. NPDC088348 TaxID=3365853 RepID=UPI00381C651B
MSITVVSAARCPDVRGRERCAAHRPFPSITHATWCGTAHRRSPPGPGEGCGPAGTGTEHPFASTVTRPHCRPAIPCRGGRLSDGRTPTVEPLTGCPPRDWGTSRSAHIHPWQVGTNQGRQPAYRARTPRHRPVLGGLLPAVAGGHGPQNSAVSGGGGGGAGVALLLFGLLLMVADAVTMCVMEGRSGQTVGKRAVGIRLVRTQSPQPIGFGLSLGRRVLHVLDTIVSTVVIKTR